MRTPYFSTIRARSRACPAMNVNGQTFPGGLLSPTIHRRNKCKLYAIRTPNDIDNLRRRVTSSADGWRLVVAYINV